MLSGLPRMRIWIAKARLPIVAISCSAALVIVLAAGCGGGSSAPPPPPPPPAATPAFWPVPAAQLPSATSTGSSSTEAHRRKFRACPPIRALADDAGERAGGGGVQTLGHAAGKKR